MNHRILGKTGLKVSEISLGTWQLGGGWGRPFDEKGAQKILEKALDSGINLFDTADVYDNQQSERAVGKFIKSKKEQLFVATKIGRRINPHVSTGYTPEVLEKYVDDALKNTGLDHLDLVQLHCPHSEVYFREEIFRKLEDIKRSGRVLHFGVSVEKVDEAIRASEYEVVETVQIIFNMFRLKPLDRCFSVLKQRKVGIIVRVPLASGLLTGRITSKSVFEPGDHRQFNRNGEQFDKGETFSGVPFDVGLRAVEELKDVFKTDNLAPIALRWTLMFPEVSTVIPGASKAGQVGENVKAAELPTLSEKGMSSVEAIYRKRIEEHVGGLW